MNPAPPAALAVVIPAYKTQFLRATLQSFADQTDRRFQIYVGDDASPGPVEAIVAEFSGKIPIRYHRFGENLGGTSLVGHWTRCLERTTEPWLWLFSDDDFLEPGCVAAFYAALEKTAGAHDAYRFSTIEERDGGIATARAKHPPLQNGKDFLCEQLRGPHNSVMQEIIFSREAWRRAGIPDFPLAWFADDAFIAALGEPRPLCGLSGPRIHWRLGGGNLTGDNSRARTRDKFRATALHARWALDFLTAQKMERTAAAQLVESWYYEHVLPREVFLDRRCIADTMRLASDCWQRSATVTGLKLAAFNARLLGKKITRKLRR